MIPRADWFKLGLITYLLLSFVGSFWMIGLIYSGTVTHLLGIQLGGIQEYAYYAFAGAIGGSLYAMRIFHDYYERLTPRWAIWYVLRPIKCGGAAVMTIVLFSSGIMLLEAGDSMEAKVGIAFLVGFGHGKVMDKLKTLTEALFNGKSSRPQDQENGGSSRDSNGSGTGNGGNGGDSRDTDGSGMGNNESPANGYGSSSMGRDKQAPDSTSAGGSPDSSGSPQGEKDGGSQPPGGSGG